MNFLSSTNFEIALMAEEAVMETTREN